MELLFNSGDLRDYLQDQKDRLVSEVNSYQSDYLLKASEGDLIQYLTSQHTLHTPNILVDRIYQHEPTDVNIDVSSDRSRYFSTHGGPFFVRGTAITISIPFEGEAVFFRYRPSTFTYNPPQGRVISQEIQLTYEVTSPDPEGLAREYKQTLGTLQQYLKWIEQDVNQFNDTLNQLARDSIISRRSKLLADQGMSAALGIPLKRRDDPPKTYAVPNVQRKPTVSRPVVDTEDPFQPEPTLADIEYENILRIIQAMVDVMERSPKAFSHMGEEDLRHQFLVQLNGQYQGQATGETFNFNGKTDILIRIEGKNIFIAECKFWTGPKGLTDTVDQLLSYTSWRDTKTAVLLFNKDRHLSTVLEKLPDVVEHHACYKQSLGVENETVYRYLFHQPNDPNRELFLTILVFDIPR